MDIKRVISSLTALSMALNCCSVTAANEKGVNVIYMSEHTQEINQAIINKHTSRKGRHNTRIINDYTGLYKENGNNIMVKYAGVFDGKNDIQGYGEVIRENGDIAVYNIPDSSNIGKAIKCLSETDGVELVEPDYKIKLNSINDEYYTQQWGLSNTSLFNINADGIDSNDKVTPEAGYDINAEEAWDMYSNTDGKEVIVAIIDGRINIEHPDLKAHMWRNKREIPLEEGTTDRDNDNNGYKNE